MRKMSPVLASAALALLLLTSCRDEHCATCPQGSRSPYAQLSDRALLSEIAKVEGRVSIGFKESNARAGVDSTGRNLTSDATTQRMRQFVVQRGISVSWYASRIPAIAGRIPLQLALIAELRRHPNVDYLEPAAFGTFSTR